MKKTLTYIPTDISPCCENCNNDVPKCDDCDYLFGDEDIIYCDTVKINEKQAFLHLCKDCYNEQNTKCELCGRRKKAVGLNVCDKCR